MCRNGAASAPNEAAMSGKNSPICSESTDVDESADFGENNGMEIGLNVRELEIVL